jgi:hypothetical protein
MPLHESIFTLARLPGIWHRSGIGVLATALLMAPPVGADELPSAPSNGDTTDVEGARKGFLTYLAPVGIWVDPEVFWYRWAESEKAFLWNNATTPPVDPNVKDGDMFIMETGDGPCLLVRKEGAWRKAGETYGWSQRMREYGGCTSVAEAVASKE